MDNEFIERGPGAKPRREPAATAQAGGPGIGMAPQPALAGAVAAGGAAATGPGGPDASRVPLSRRELLALAVFLAILIGGTFYAKWHPYYLKGFHVAGTHSLGASIVSGHSAAAPRGWHAAVGFAESYGKSIWQALVVGLLVAAGVQELLPRRLLRRLLSGRGRRCAARGALAAVPSMMCTCCSAPSTVALARSDTPVGATLGYWLGNPVLNPATIVFTGFVLGWRWAALRAGVGVVLVLGAATLAQRWFADLHISPASLPTTDAIGENRRQHRSVPHRYFATLGRLALALIPEYAVAVLALGAARAFLFPAVSPAVGHALWLVALLAVTGTLFVIPTAGEIPIIQTFLAFGLGAGAGGALLITLPAVSLPSLLMVGRALPARVLAFVAGSVAVTGLLTAAIAAALRL